MSEPHRVLVAEDDPAVAEFLQLALRAMGHEVDVAPDGQSAVEMAAERPPQFVLLDALLPKLDGFGVLRELRKALPQVPIVMMSGIYKKRSYQQEAIDLGAREYLFKPLSVLKLWELADRYLGDAAPGTREPEGFAGTPLSEQPLAQVLAEVHGAQSTGMLFVRGPKGTAILFIEDGRVIFGRTSDPSTRLDRILESRNALSAEARRRAKELLRQAKGRARYGDLLVEAGLLTPEALRGALAQQQQLHVTRPLTWSEGRSQFFVSEAPRQESFKLDLDMPALIVWAARHVPAGPALDAWLPGSEHQLRLKTDLAPVAERFKLTTEELELLRLADGTRTVGALRAMGRLAQVDVDRLTAALVALDLLEVTAAPAAGLSTSTAFAGAPSAGAVASNPPARVLLGTGMGGKTGALKFEGEGDAQRTIWFDAGRIAFANSNDPQDRLGQVLLRKGFIDTAQLKQALATARSTPGKALGRILVDQGALQLDDLHLALVAQVREVVGGVLRWHSGTFYFSSGRLPTGEIVPLALPPLELVLDALRELPVGELRDRLPATATPLRKTWQCFELAEELRLTALEDRILGALDDNPSLGRLIDGCEEGPEDVLRSVNLLLCLGLIEESPTASGEKAASRKLDDEFAAIDDESFGDEEFESVGAAPAPTPQPASSALDFDDDESFDPVEEPAAPPAAASGGPVTGCEESFAGLADDPPMEGLLTEMPAGGPVTGCEQSFAGLADDPPMDGLLTEMPAGGPVTGCEESFAGLADEPELDGLLTEAPAPPPAAAAAPARAPAPELDFGNLDSLGQDAPPAGPGSEPLFDLSSDLPGSSGGPLESGPSSAASAATATAVLEAPSDEGEWLIALQTFLALLSDHLATHPGAVPEHVLAMLPAEIRERFGM